MRRETGTVLFANVSRNPRIFNRMRTFCVGASLVPSEGSSVLWALIPWRRRGGFAAGMGSPLSRLRAAPTQISTGADFTHDTTAQILTVHHLSPTDCRLDPSSAEFATSATFGDIEELDRFRAKPTHCAAVSASFSRTRPICDDVCQARPNSTQSAPRSAEFSRARRIWGHFAKLGRA